MVNTRFEAPEGTSRVKFSDWPDEPDWPVTGTPLVSSPPPGPGSPGSSPSHLTPTLEHAEATSASRQQNGRAPWRDRVCQYGEIPVLARSSTTNNTKN